MSIQIKIPTVVFAVVGDGTSTSVVFSFGEFPFPDKPPGKVSAISLFNHPFDGDSISFTSKVCTVTFAQAFTGDVDLSFHVTYDPS